MSLEIKHVEVHVSSLEKAREFYVTKLGLVVLQETPAINSFAVKAGGVRVSIFGGHLPSHNNKAQTGTHIIFCTKDIVQTVKDLQAKGVIFTDTIFEAPGFAKVISTTDPDGNVIEIGQYLRDPLKKI